MKKAIRAIVLLAALSFFAVSCTKSTMNTIAITGYWELIRTVVTEDGRVIKDVGPAQDNMLTFYRFVRNGVVTREKRAIGGESTVSGRWYVEGNTLLMTLLGEESKSYHIEKAGLLKLILTLTEYRDGKEYITTLTLSNSSSSD